MLIYSDVFFLKHKVFNICNIVKTCQVSPCPHLREMEIIIDFTGNLGHLCGVITH